MADMESHGVYAVNQSLCIANQVVKRKKSVYGKFPSLIPLIKERTNSFNISLTTQFYCISSEGSTAIVHPTMCCKGASQICCCDRRVSFLNLKTVTPLDPDFPCLFTMCGVTLFYNFQFVTLFCAKWKDIKASKGSAIPVPHSAAPA